MTNINETLNKRATTHGSFIINSAISQAIKDEFCSVNELKFYQREALDMIAHKIARICAGDPNFIDSWLDIAGYATLVVNELKKTEGATNVRNVKQIVVNGELIDEQYKMAE